MVGSRGCEKRVLVRRDSLERVSERVRVAEEGVLTVTLSLKVINPTSLSGMFFFINSNYSQSASLTISNLVFYCIFGCIPIKSMLTTPKGYDVTTLLAILPEVSMQKIILCFIYSFGFIGN